MAEIKHDWWHYDQLPSGEPYDWEPAARGGSKWDAFDFHLDLGCGRLKKARLGIDRHPDPGVDIVMDLNTMLVHGRLMEWEKFMGLPSQWVTNAAPDDRLTDKFDQPHLPFDSGSIESIISHHCLEHIGDGFLPLMDECWRVLAPGGVFRIITPLFPSKAAVEDPDHKRYFMEESFDTFVGGAGGEHFHESFSTPYTNCRFEMLDKDITPPLPNPKDWWGPDDVREIRVALGKRA